MRIVEIAPERAEQGIHRPFRCRGEDDHWYYVKGSSVGFRGLRSEWLGARLAERLELPVPPFEVVQVPTPLLQTLEVKDQVDLGSGSCFASSQLVPAADFRFADIHAVSGELQARILLFDWWICNGDRILGPKGGNPNMIWAGQPRELWIIDHNLALIQPPDPKDFLDNHVFRDAYPWFESHWQEWRSLLPRLCDEVEALWDELPDDWIGHPNDFGCESVKRTLRRCQSSIFWEFEGVKNE